MKASGAGLKKKQIGKKSRCYYSLIRPRPPSCSSQAELISPKRQVIDEKERIVNRDIGY
jgi:hypothetical protein